MQNDFKAILLKTLEIIDYQDNKEKIVTKLLDICINDSLNSYMNMLSEERQKELRHIIYEVNPLRGKGLIEPYLATEEYKDLFKMHSQKLMQDFFTAVLPTLSEKQKKNLDTYFATLQQEQHIDSTQNL